MRAAHERVHSLALFVLDAAEQACLLLAGMQQSVPLHKLCSQQQGKQALADQCMLSVVVFSHCQAGLKMQEAALETALDEMVTLAGISYHTSTPWPSMSSDGS